MGAAGDGRAPTEERACVNGWGFCSTGAAEGRPRSPCAMSVTDTERVVSN